MEDIAPRSQYSLYPRSPPLSEHRFHRSFMNYQAPSFSQKRDHGRNPDARLHIVEDSPELDFDLGFAEASGAHARDDASVDRDSTMPSLVSFGNSPQQKFVGSVDQHPSSRTGEYHNLGRQSYGSSTVNSVVMTRDSSNASYSEQSTAPTETRLGPLLTKPLADSDDPMDAHNVDDPKDFTLLAPPPAEMDQRYSLEDRVDRIMSLDHLREIFADRELLLRFTGFLNTHRPEGVRTLIYYLDALKALNAIRYANAISRNLNALHGHAFSEVVPSPTVNRELDDRAHKAFETLAREELPAYVAHVWIQIVSEIVQKRVTWTLAPHLREASEGLAEVYCLTDPGRADNPIVFLSEEFQRSTGYGLDYCIGRNCRLLQGPRTSRDSTRRLKQAIEAGKGLSEVLLNYRRDGQPFMNLLMMAPLYDDHGKVCYFLGAQVDVSGLVKECIGLEAMHLLLADELAQDEQATNRHPPKGEFEALSEMFSRRELQIVRKTGGRMHQRHDQEDDDAASVLSNRPRLVLTDAATADAEGHESASSQHSTTDTMLTAAQASGRLSGVYEHYLLIRPAPSLRILFTSPSLRVPGILQTPFLSRVGGSPRIRAELTAAFEDGRSVTAKVRWLTRPDSGDDGDGRTRWLHCTPLLNHKREIGVWIVVLVDTEALRSKFKIPPAVANNRQIRTKAKHNEDRRGTVVIGLGREPRLRSYGSTIAPPRAQDQPSHQSSVADFGRVDDARPMTKRDHVREEPRRDHTKEESRRDHVRENMARNYGGREDEVIEKMQRSLGERRDEAVELGQKPEGEAKRKASRFLHIGRRSEV